MIATPVLAGYALDRRGQPGIAVGDKACEAIDLFGGPVGLSISTQLRMPSRMASALKVCFSSVNEVLVFLCVVTVDSP
jgi:hypothetical protein